VISSLSHLLASGSWDKSIVIWDTETSKPLQTLKGHMGQITSLVFSAKGNQFASASRDNTIQMWDVKKEEPLRTLTGHNGPVSCNVFSPQGHFASASNDFNVMFWNLKKRTMLSLRGHISVVVNVTFCPDGRLVVSAFHDCTIRIWDTRNGCSIK
jgi:WD40 repeat protein